MDTKKSPNLMQMLSGQMRYMGARQKVLAQNISNIDTPTYRAQDLKKVDFADMVSTQTQQVSLSTTSPKHFSGNRGNQSAFATEKVTKPFEMSPTGNGVVLEEQMAKISDTSANYEISSALYKKFTQLYRAALGTR
jgi:flagellar basal-body rod protein FlgB